MTRRLAVLAVAALAAVACGSNAGAATTWAGSFRLPAAKPAVGMSLRLDGTRATVSLAAGHAGATAAQATSRAGRVRFALPGRPARLVFDGRRGRTLAGSVRQGSLRGSFRLVCGSRGVLPYLGLYRGAPGAATVVIPEGLPPWLVELPSGDVHGLGPRLSVGARLGDTAGDGSLTADAAGITWTRGASTVRYGRVPLRQEEVRFGALAGTLTVPAGPGPFPAVAMVHGSGVRTRSELQTFVFFAALHGIAVLAYDKRGVGQSGGVYRRRPHRHVGRSRRKGDSSPSAPLDRLEADVRARKPTGFDPRPFLARLAIPAFWVYGDSDGNVPTGLCIEALIELAPEHDYSWVVLHTTHTLLDLPSGLNRDIPRSRGFAAGLYTAIEEWLRGHGIGV